MRCAIYTRKSADEASDSQFSTIESQREMCEKYAGSQAGEGWTIIDTRYDDLGFSGGTLDRPSLNKLINDIKNGSINTVVVYKIDRLSRSLRDFLNLVAIFEQHNVTFVAVTQSFSTTTSMGRLTLNILLSFAQFEREMTGDRLRDWFAGARKRGLWLHGARPFGYRVQDLQLIVDPDEAAIVRHIYTRYPKVGSARRVAAELNAKGYKNKAGRPFTLRVVTQILQNRLYCGDLVHKGKPVPGKHEAIISDKTWQATQAAMAESGRRRSALPRHVMPGALKGLLFNEAGLPLIHIIVARSGGIYRYYIPSRYRYDSLPTARFRGAALETSVVTLLDRITGGEGQTKLSKAEYIRSFVERIDVGETAMTVTLVTGAQITAEHQGRLLLQRKPRTAPSWLRQARQLIGRGMSKAKAAEALRVPTSQFYRACEKYGIANPPRPLPPCSKNARGGSGRAAADR